MRVSQGKYMYAYDFMVRQERCEKEAENEDSN